MTDRGKLADVRPIDANSIHYTRVLAQKGLNMELAAKSSIESLPTLDYAPVRHGEWVWNGFDGIGWECSLCKHEESKEAKKPEASYCPNCGAKMDGGK